MVKSDVTVVGGSRYTERSHWWFKLLLQLASGSFGRIWNLRMGVGQLCACSCEALVAASVALP